MTPQSRWRHSKPHLPIIYQQVLGNSRSDQVHSLGHFVTRCSKLCVDGLHGLALLSRRRRVCVKLQRLTIGIIWVTEPAERHILLNKTPKRYQLNLASQHFGGGFGNHKVDRYYVLGECRFEVKVSRVGHFEEYLPPWACGWVWPDTGCWHSTLTLE